MKDSSVLGAKSQFVQRTLRPTFKLSKLAALDVSMKAIRRLASATPSTYY